MWMLSLLKSKFIMEKQINNTYLKVIYNNVYTGFFFTSRGIQTAYSKKKGGSLNLNIEKRKRNKHWKGQNFLEDPVQAKNVKKEAKINWENRKKKTKQKTENKLRVKNWRLRVKMAGNLQNSDTWEFSSRQSERGKRRYKKSCQEHQPKSYHLRKIDWFTKNK